MLLKRGVGHPPFNWETFRLLAAHRGLVVATIWGSLFRGLSFTVVTYLLLFMTEELELSKVVAGLYLSTAYVISAGARVGWGAVSDFLFRARRLPACGLVGMLATAALAGIALTGSGLPESAVIVFVVLLGASTFSWAGLWTNLVGEMVSPGAVRDGAGRFGNGDIARPPGLSAPFWPMCGLDRLVSTSLGNRRGHCLHEHGSTRGPGPPRRIQKRRIGLVPARRPGKDCCKSRGDRHSQHQPQG